MTNAHKAMVAVSLTICALMIGAVALLIGTADNSPICPTFQGANVSPHTTPTLTPGCNIAQGGRFTNGDTYTVFPDGSVITK